MADRTPLAFPFALANSAAKLVKEAIAAQVVSLFSEESRAYPTRSRNAAAMRSEERLFPPSAVTRRVHGDVTTMMVGGISGLLLQMLHPAVLAGVWDHSSFRADLHGRLRRTARFIAVTTYGRKSDAEAAIARVRQIHELVCGVLPNGAPYAASNPALLATSQQMLRAQCEEVHSSEMFQLDQPSGNRCAASDASRSGASE